MKSNNVLIIADKDDLIRLCGVPCSIYENQQFNCYTNFVHSTDKDTVFYFNILTYRKNYDNTMSYIEKNGKIRLTYFDFKINKKAVIYTPKLKLHRKLKLSDVKRAYNYNEKYKDMGKVIGVMADALIEGSRCVYHVVFSIGVHECAIIELLFDSKKKLRYMTIRAYDF
jgi:hypothetical protein